MTEQQESRLQALEIRRAELALARDILMLELEVMDLKKEKREKELNHVNTNSEEGESRQSV